jgi:hypothetical protein
MSSARPEESLMPAIDGTLRGAVALVLGLLLLGGCRPATDGEPAAPEPPAAEAGSAIPIPDGGEPGVQGRPTTYRLGIIRSHDVVVVLESLGSVDAVGRALEPAIRRALPNGPASPRVLDGADLIPITGIRLRFERTPDAPLPLVDCISVTPWSGADTFLGVAYEDRARPTARLSEFVLRYPSAGEAAAGALRIRHQFEDCPDGGPGGSARVRVLDQRLPDGAGEAFMGERLVRTG